MLTTMILTSSVAAAGNQLQRVTSIPDRQSPGMPCADGPALDAGQPVVAVLDTNVVLDLLVFNDSRAAALRHSLERRELHWVATAAMFDELADVLARPDILRRRADPLTVLQEAHALLHRLIGPPTAALHGPQRAPRCADPDDQMFIDLAWSCSAQWLFSRDRALLALAKPSRLRDLRIAVPEVWAVADLGWSQKRRPEPPC